jgi:hypothetical protein
MGNAEFVAHEDPLGMVWSEGARKLAPWPSLS